MVRWIPSLAVCTFLFAVGAVSSVTTAQDFKKPLNKLDLKDGDSLVFLGDSITHQRLYTQYVENYFYTRYPKIRLKTHNAGVGGAKAWDALQRFDKDVAAYKPKYVTVLLGMNDGKYQPFDKETFETYQKDMKEVVARIKKTGATPVLITPTMFDSRAARIRKWKRSAAAIDQYNAVLAYYGAWLREVATNEGYGFVDMYHSLNALTLAARKKRPKFTLIADAVHPDAPGQAVMAYSIIRDLLPRSGVSSIVVARAGKKLVARGVGGKIANLKARPDGGVEFTFQANHLPWIVPDEAQKAIRMLRVPQVANGEVLRALSLSRGKWELHIDGQVVGTFTNQAYFNGLQLHNSKTTPQYKQAMEIAKLNRKRNEGPIRKLRDEWRTFQQAARFRESLKSQPDNEALKKRLAVAEKKLKGLDGRIKTYQQAAKTIEDEIFKLNKPKQQKYVIKKIMLASVQGTVTLDGKPLPAARIRFVGSDGSAAIGTTDPQGRFTLATNGLPGVKAGKYRIAISTDTAPGAESIAARFSNPKQSVLTFEVPVGGTTTANFRLSTGR